MAKRYWAQIIDLDEEIEASCISGVSDHEEAAESMIADFVGAMGGEITEGGVRVWIEEGGQEKVYDWKAEFTMPDLDEVSDEEEVEVEGEIELTERV